VDTVTHGLIGVTAGIALVPRRLGRAGVAVFAVASVLPDIDGPIYKETLEYVLNHRGATHSLVGAVVFSLGLAVLAKLLRAPPRIRALFLTALAGVLLHLTFDVLTWWGTMIFWPFADTRVGVGVLFIIDLVLATILVAPLLVALAQKLRGRVTTRIPFRAATALAAAYVLLAAGARSAAWDALDHRADLEGSRAIDVFPQPFSPFRWSLVEERQGELRVNFVDLLRGHVPREIRSFPREDSPAVKAAAASPTGRVLLWFYRVPVCATSPVEGGTEVVWRDLAYETWPDLGRPVPFRYRMRLTGEREVVEEGFVRR
jgi:inner membrane protein